MPEYMELNRTAVFYAEGDNPETAIPHEGKIVAVYDGTGGKSYGVQVGDTDEIRVRAHEATVYLASVGDWVLLADGTRATVTRANPAATLNPRREGTYYDLLLQGGAERHVYHWGTDNHLTRPAGFGRPESTEPLFVVKEA